MANKVDFIIGAEDRFSGKFGKILKTLRRPEAILGSLAVVSGLGTAALALMTTQLANTADATGKLAGRINANVEGLSELQFVAQRSGVAIASLNVGLQRQVRRVSEAARGTGEAVKALKELGLEAKELNLLKADEQFIEIAKAIEKLESGSDKVRLAMKLWDTEGVSLLQTLEGGTAGIEEMREEARKLGIVMDKETTEAARRFNDELTNLQSILPGFRNLIGSNLLDPFANLIKLVKDIATTDNALLRFIENWTSGVGIIVDSFAEGTRKILFEQDRVEFKIKGWKEEAAKPVDINIDTAEADKKLNDLRALLDETFPEDDPDQFRNFATAQKDAEALEREVRGIRDRITELSGGELDINTNQARQEIRDLQFILQEIREEQAIIAEPRLRLDAILKDLNDIEENFDPIRAIIEEPKKLVIDDTQAIQSLKTVQSVLDSIPRVTRKRVEFMIEAVGAEDLSPELVESMQNRIADDLNRGSSPIQGGLVRGGPQGASVL